MISRIWHCEVFRNVVGPLVVALLMLAAFTATLITATEAPARDLGQWENSDPRIKEWYQGLRQPDNPNASCCGEADAYFADKVIVRGNKVFAVITDDRPDGPLGRPHIPVGTEFEIPANKLKWDRGNPVGRNVLFVTPGGTVFCFVQGTLT